MNKFALISILVSVALTVGCTPPQYEASSPIVNESGQHLNLGTSTVDGRPLQLPLNVLCSELKRNIEMLSKKAPGSPLHRNRSAEYQRLHCDLVY